MNKLPRSIARGPVGNPSVVLIGAVLRIFADAGVRAMCGRAPKDIDEIGFPGNAGHNKKGAQLPLRV